MLYRLKLSPGTYYACQDGSQVKTCGRENALCMSRVEADKIQARLKRGSAYPRATVIPAESKEKAR